MDVTVGVTIETRQNGVLVSVATKRVEKHIGDNPAFYRGEVAGLLEHASSRALDMAERGQPGRPIA